MKFKQPRQRKWKVNFELISIAALGTIMFMLVMLSANAANIKSEGDGNWNSTVNDAPWPGGTVPGAGDDVTIEQGFNVVVTADASAKSLTIKSSKSGKGGKGTKNATLTINSGVTLTILGDVDIEDIRDDNVSTLILMPGAVLELTGDLDDQLEGVVDDRGGLIRFNGSANRTILVDDPIHDLSIANNGRQLTMQNDLTVTGTIDFETDGFITLDGFDLVINDWSSSVTNFSPNRSIIIDDAACVSVNGVDNLETASIPLSISDAATDYCRADMQNLEAGSQSYIVKVANYLNYEGTFAGGTPYTEAAVNVTWEITSASTSTQLTLYWNTALEMNGLDTSDCQMRHHDGTSWGYEGTGGSAGNEGANISSKSATVASFSPFTVGGPLSPLPVELLNFDVEELDEATAEISWATASELDNDYFAIERLIDGEFQEIGRISGAGNSNRLLNYSYRDIDLVSGTYYYRLRQVDFNGEFEVFEVEAVIIGSGSENVIETTANYISSHELNRVKMKSSLLLEEVTLQVVNLNGQVVAQCNGRVTINGHVEHEMLNTSNVKKGLHFIQISGSTQRGSIPIILN